MPRSRPVDRLAELRGAEFEVRYCREALALQYATTARRMREFAADMEREAVWVAREETDSSGAASLKAAETAARQGDALGWLLANNSPAKLVERAGDLRVALVKLAMARQAEMGS